MTLNPNVMRLRELGGIPTYVNDPEDLSLLHQVAEIVETIELDEQKLGSEDLVTLFNLLPDSCGEDYYGISFIVLLLLERNIANLKPVSPLRPESEWLSIMFDS